MPTSAFWGRRAVAALLAGYGLLSVACWFEWHPLMALLDVVPSLVWILGPAAWLFHKHTYAASYLGSLSLVLILVGIAYIGIRRQEPVVFVGALIGGVIVWVGSVLLVAASVF